MWNCFQQKSNYFLSIYSFTEDNSDCEIRSNKVKKQTGMGQRQGWAKHKWMAREYDTTATKPAEVIFPITSFTAIFGATYKTSCALSCLRRVIRNFSRHCTKLPSTSPAPPMILIGFFSVQISSPTRTMRMFNMIYIWGGSRNKTRKPREECEKKWGRLGRGPTSKLALKFLGCWGWTWTPDPSASVLGLQLCATTPSEEKYFKTFMKDYSQWS